MFFMPTYMETAVFHVSDMITFIDRVLEKQVYFPVLMQALKL